MKIGDIVQFDNRRWLVLFNLPGKLCRLRTWDGAETDVPGSADTNPEMKLTLEASSGDWPFLTAPLRAKDGPIVRATLARNGILRDLEPLVDWAPSSGLRPGGPVFLNPRLQLRVGEVIGAIHQSGRQVRLSVAQGLASVKARQVRLAKERQPVVRKSVYERLMDDDLFEDP